MHACLDDVITTHELIRAWLGASAPDSAVLDALLARFSPDYTMITPAGTELDYASLRAFFSSAGGSRRGLQMQISELALLQESAAGAVVAYRERQTLADGSSTARLSTVVYEKSPDGKLLWRHLHETWAMASA